MPPLAPGEEGGEAEGIEPRPRDLRERPKEGWHAIVTFSSSRGARRAP